MEKLSDKLLQKVINTEIEFMRRFEEKYQKEAEIDIYIVAFLKELQERRGSAAKEDDLRNEFGNVVYEELAEDETNSRANSIIDAYDAVVKELIGG
ncbi:MAG: hypothetical protein NC548_63785 [Lachnospiraceae bacterium]|nr:hypothetical protein [Lachnospiraceae bacterium]